MKAARCGSAGSRLNVKGEVMTRDDLIDRQTGAPTVQQTGTTTAFGGLETREPLTAAQIDGIARELLAQLSLEEKIDMMSGGHDFFEGMLHFGSAGYKRHALTTVGASRAWGSRACGSPTGRAVSCCRGRPRFLRRTRGARAGTHCWRSGSAMPWGARRAPMARTSSAVRASTCSGIPPGAGRKRPTVRTPITWARWARR
jgi:hypothetical protein